MFLRFEDNGRDAVQRGEIAKARGGEKLIEQRVLARAAAGEDRDCRKKGRDEQPIVPKH